MADQPRMTPQERMRLAQDARRLAISKPGLPPQLRARLRRAASNAVKSNALLAKRDQK